MWDRTPGVRIQALMAIHTGRLSSDDSVVMAALGGSQVLSGDS